MVDTFIADVSSFIVIVLGIRPLHYGLWLFHLLCYFCVRIRSPQFKEDSSSTLWIHPLFSLLWFHPLSQGRFVFSDYRIRPLLLIKLGFTAVIKFYVWIYFGIRRKLLCRIFV